MERLVFKDGWMFTADLPTIRQWGTSASSEPARSNLANALTALEAGLEKLLQLFAR